MILKTFKSPSCNRSLNEVEGILAEFAGNPGQPGGDVGRVFGRVIGADSQLGQVVDEFASVELVRHLEDGDQVFLRNEK